MKTFEVIVRNNLLKVDLMGFFEAETKEEAGEKARAGYAIALGTSPEHIEIVSTKIV